MRRMMATMAMVLMTSAAMAQDEPTYLDDRSTPKAVISSFYNAIDRQEFARAFSYYQDGEGVEPFEQFVAGYKDTASVTVEFGQSAQEGAAGSTYWTLPVKVDAVDAKGTHALFTGCYTLRLANPTIQEELPFRPLHIVEGHLKKADAQSFAPAKCDPAG